MKLTDDMKIQVVIPGQSVIRQIDLVELKRYILEGEEKEKPAPTRKKKAPTNETE